MKNIFISSTFRDMQAERDLIQERVLPELRQEARKYGENVGVIDLRWGVDTSKLETEAGAAKVLTVCLDEIERSHPYMLIFLGERYGWIPDKKLIEKTICDRTDKYVIDDYEKSVTALEIEYGALSEQYGELKNCIVCLREPVGHLVDGKQRELYIDGDAKRQKKLAQLKECIKRKIGEENLITYSAKWDLSKGKLCDFFVGEESLEQVLVKRYIELFGKEWESYKNKTPQEKEQLSYAALKKEKLRFFVGREALLDEYYQTILESNVPLILQGEVGSGKTAIMCKLIERLETEGKQVFSFFAGVGSRSTNAENLAKQMKLYLERISDADSWFGEIIDKDILGENPSEEELAVVEMHSREIKWAHYMQRIEHLENLLLSLPQEEKIYLFIDALDQLYPDEHVKKLDFFLKGKNVQVIASCTDTFDLPSEKELQRSVKVIPALEQEEALAIAENILKNYSRNAYEEIKQAILKKENAKNPLYISFLIQRLNMMDEGELYHANTEAEIIALGTKLIQQMPDSLEDAAIALIENGIEKVSDNEKLLYEALNYIAVSRNGLRMQDIQMLFKSEGIDFPILNFSLLLKYLDSFFYYCEDGRIQFTHKVIGKGITAKINDRTTYEQKLKNYIKALNLNDTLRRQEGIYYARICKDYEFGRQLLEQAYKEKQSELLDSIRIETLADEGRFVCEIIDAETKEVAALVKMMWTLLEASGLVKESFVTRVRIGKKLVACEEKIDKQEAEAEELQSIFLKYREMLARALLLIADNQLARGKDEAGLNTYFEALSYITRVCERKEDLRNDRIFIEILKGMYRSLQKVGNEKVALDYLNVAKEEARMLYERSGMEKDRVLLAELEMEYKKCKMDE